MLGEFVLVENCFDVYVSLLMGEFELYCEGSGCLGML